LIIKSYLQLIRTPGIFTVFSNILLGFFVSQNGNFDWNSLCILLTASGALFLSGMALNDYFDYKIDKKERPNRPLPSKKIPRKNALYIGFGFLIIANILASFVGMNSLVVTAIMSVLIIGYDCKLKNVFGFGIFNLSVIRFLNVILGTTAVAFNQEIIHLAIPIAIFVSAISVLAKEETSSNSKKSEFVNVLLIIATIIVTIIIIFKQGFAQWLFLVIFIISVYIPYFVFRERAITNIQKKVTFQLFAIILLDAVIISAFSEIVFAIITISLYVPAYLTLRKLYVT